jgi:hypothetical protein
VRLDDDLLLTLLLLRVRSAARYKRSLACVSLSRQSLLASSARGAMRRRRLAAALPLSLACCAAAAAAAAPTTCFADDTLGSELLASASTPASVDYLVSLRRELHSTPEARACEPHSLLNSPSCATAHRLRPCCVVARS